MSRFLRFFIWCIFLCIYSTLNGYFEIVEVFPNTTDDKNLEYIKIQNTSSGSQSLEGYYIQDASEKKYIFEDQMLEPEETYIFYRTETKLILNNSNETLELFSHSWELVDTVVYDTSEKWIPITFIEDLEILETLEILEPPEEIQEEEVEAFVFELQIDLQQPSYITQSGSSDTYICDTSRWDCKVNFNFESSFWDSFKLSDHFCDIDFWLWELTWQEYKCNPSTVIFPNGETPVKIQIGDDDSWNIIFEKVITVIKDESVSESVKINQEYATTYISKPRFKVQSGLTGNGTNYYCTKVDCTINLEYERASSRLGCYWNFSSGRTSSQKTKKLCNPWYVDFPEWIFEIELRVYEKDFPKNEKTTKFFIHNTLKEEHQDENITTEENKIIFKPEEEQDIKVDVAIELQWVMWKEKSLSGSILSCHDTDSCYINLTASWSNLDSDFIYNWKQNNEIFSSSMNPKWQWIESWEHEIVLEVYHDTQQIWEEILFVEVYPKIATQSMEEDLKSDAISYEPLLFEETKEVKESLNISKSFTQNFLVLKYDGLRISWKSPPWSLVKILSDGTLIWEWISNEKGRYRIVSKNFLPWKYNFESKIILESWEEIFISDSWVASIENIDRKYWFSSKKASYSARSYTKKTPILELQESSQKFEEENSQELSLLSKISFIFLLVLVGVFVIGHMILIEFQSIYGKNISLVHSLQFKVRHKVTLIL